MAKREKVIEIVAYDPRWPEIFELEAHRIQQALQGNCLATYHVGSTSVPGLAAKAQIDIIAVVHRPEDSIGDLQKIGFEYRGEYNIPMHYGFSKSGKPAVNLHVYQRGNPQIELNLSFRNYFRRHPKTSDQYAQLKYALIEKKSSHEKSSSGFTGYTLGKDAFIKGVLRQAKFRRLHIAFWHPS